MSPKCKNISAGHATAHVAAVWRAAILAASVGRAVLGEPHWDNGHPVRCTGTTGVSPVAVGCAPRARRYGTTTTLKNRMVGRAVPGEPPSSGTSAHGPSSDADPFNTACISAPVQRFVFGSHSTFGLPSTSSMDTIRKSFVASVRSSPSA